MNFKKLLFAVAILFSMSMSAQELFPPVEIIQGTFIGTTIPLRDFPVEQQNLNTDPKTMTIFPNRSRYNAKVNDDALPLGDVDHQAQKNFGQINTRDIEQNLAGN